MAVNERHKEINRRRHRKLKLAKLEKRLAKATNSEKAEIVRKLRELTPGANVIVERWQLADR